MTAAPRWAKELQDVLDAAVAQAGLDGSAAEPMRLSENALFRLPRQRAVARIAPATPDALASAAMEVRVSRWLDDHSMPVVRALSDVDQPVEADGRVVTFWHELELAGQGEYPKVAEVLRRLHALPIPTDLPLTSFAPFVRLADHIQAATTLSQDDRDWLRNHGAELRQRYANGLPPGLPHCVIHGNPSIDNVVTTAAGETVLLDLDRVAIGPPEWDLTTIAVDLTTFGTMARSDYSTFCDTYGYDVTTWPGFELLRDIRDMRNACWMAAQAATQPHTQAEAQRRVASLRGQHGPRPWGWRPVL